MICDVQVSTRGYFRHVWVHNTFDLRPLQMLFHRRPRRGLWLCLLAQHRLQISKKKKKKTIISVKLGQTNTAAWDMHLQTEIYELGVRRSSGDNSWQDVVIDKNNRADGGQEWNFLHWDCYFGAIKASQSIVSSIWLLGQHWVTGTWRTSIAWTSMRRWNSAEDVKLCWLVSVQVAPFVKRERKRATAILLRVPSVSFSSVQIHNITHRYFITIHRYFIFKFFLTCVAP